MAGDQQRPQAWPLPPCLPDKFQPVDSRHRVIGDQKVDRIPVLEDAKGCLGAACLVNGVTTGCQKLTDESPDLVIIVTQQDERRRLWDTQIDPAEDDSVGWRLGGLRQPELDRRALAAPAP